MKPGNTYVALDNRITENDYRSTLRLTENSAEESKNSDGWTWVAALVVAALFIVSGYLDQESGMLERASATGVADRYASNTSAPQALVANANGSGRQFDKGY